jgi:hypothetical protein
MIERGALVANLHRQALAISSEFQIRSEAEMRGEMKYGAYRVGKGDLFGTSCGHD